MWYEFLDYCLIASQADYCQSGGYDILMDVVRQDPAIFSQTDSLWIDEWTKLIRADMTVYNSDTGLASVVTVAFEFTPGGIFQYSTVSTFLLIDKGRRMVTLTFLVVVLSIVVFFQMIVECWKMKIEGIRKYFESGRNKFIFLEICFCTLTFACFALLESARHAKLKEFREIRFEKETLKKFVEFQSLAKFDYCITCMCALIGLIHFVKLFQTRLIPFSELFSNMVYNLRYTTFFPCIGTLQFQILGHMMFSRHVYGFSTFMKSGVFVFLLVFNPSRYTPYLVDYYRQGGVIYFLTVAFLQQYIFINIFIALINSVFSYHKEQLKRNAKETESFVTYLKSESQAPFVGKKVQRDEITPELFAAVAYEKKAKDQFYIMSHVKVSQDKEEEKSSLSFYNTQADLSGKDLSGINSSRIYFSAIDLSGINLPGIFFSAIDLSDND